MNLPKRLLALLLINASFVVCAQEVLTLDKAIEIGLQNNNLLQVSQRQKDIAKENKTWGNAGFLPTLGVQASNTVSNTSLQQQIYTAALNTTTDTRRDGVIQTNLSGNVALNWVVFNGLRRNYAYRRLSDTYEQATAQTKVEMENTVSNISRSYYEILRQQEIVQAYQENLALYRDRLRLAEARWTSGLAPKSDVLLTKVDINSQLSLLITQQTAVRNAHIDLNRFLNRDANTSFTVTTEEKRAQLDTNTAYSGKTTTLTVTQKGVDIASDQYRENNSVYFPVLGVGAAYNFVQTQSTGGQVRFNQTVGPNVGFTLSWNLFDGFNKNRVSELGLLNMDVNKYLHADNQRVQQAAYLSALMDYRNALQIFDLQNESYNLAKESNSIARERYELGRINLFEYKETQLMVATTKIRLANARYDALNAEVELKRLNGELVK